MSTIHNPVNFNPADYRIEDYLDNRRPVYYGEGIEAYESTVREWEAGMARALGADWRSKSCHCIHCGEGNVRWITAVRHLPTDEVVVFGCDCTRRLEFIGADEFKLARLKALADARATRVKVYKARQAFVEARPELAEAIAHRADPVHARNSFIQDVLGKLEIYGSLSDRQISAVVASMARDREFAARKSAEQAEPKGDAPSGRATISGVILSSKERETGFGICIKVTLKLDNGARVYVTKPAGASDERGSRLTIRATWEVSKDDRSFAFGSRPVLVG